jgi:23S rRNA (uracil1939-C5)-methyltransferase
MARGKRQPAEPETGVVADLTPDGDGVVRAEIKTVFVGGSLPGEQIRFRRVQRHRSHDEGLLLEILQSSPDRVTPRCAHFGVCGGCALQHLEESRQIELKSQQLTDVLQRVAKVTPQHWLPPLRGPVWSYRRRARLGARYVPKKGRVIVGFRERLAPYIAALDRCEVLAEPVGSLITPLSQLLTALSIREHVPQIEVAMADTATALVLRVMREPPEADLALLREFETRHAVRLYLQPQGLESVRRLGAPATSGNTTEDLAAGRSGVDAQAVAEQLLVMDEPLRYTLPRFDVRYDFRPTDFVQINAAINTAMVDRVIELLQLTPDARVLDLFCGLGNFTLPLARRAARVLGVEGDAALVARARHNAALNGISNAQFVAADLTQPLPTTVPYLAEGFTHVVLDPPRAGALEMLPTIARFKPQMVVYISCHPGSLARDIGALVHEHGFVLRAAGVMDMFPHTAHVESLAVLTPGDARADRSSHG